MARLLLLFILLPAAELALLIEIGSRIGTGATLGLIFVTGVIGATMARSQGLRVIGTVQTELAAGRLPASSLMDAMMILLASALLITPGVLTDVIGFLCLYPRFRARVRGWLLRRFEQAVAEQRVQFEMRGMTLDGDSFATYDSGDPFDSLRSRPEGRGPIIDVTPESRGAGPERGDRNES